ncbi:hypothetical protein L1278_003925 [Pontibacter sp. HSC-36F09]|nr:hypothetical protein [Pontibacter sp. HSC-36F09]
MTVNPAGGKRMQQVNPSPAGKTPELYVLRKVTQIFVDLYYSGMTYNSSVNRNDVKAQHSWMDAGEGFTSTSSAEKKSYDFTAVTNVVNTGPKPRIELNLIGPNATTQTGIINVEPASGIARQITSFMFRAYDFQHVQGQIEFSDISTNGKVTIQIIPNAVQGSNVSVSNMRITYPHRVTLLGNTLLFNTDSTRAVNPYYEIENTTANSIAYDVTDPYNPKRIEGALSGNRKGFVIQTGPGSSHKVLVANTSSTFKPASKTASIRFRQITPNDHNYIMITNKRLMKTVAGIQKPAPLEYAAYRASAPGGGYDTLLVQMDQVVDQFHYGEFSSNAIRKFMLYMLTSARPKQLFLIGKGMKYADPDYRSLRDSHWTGAHNRYSFYHVNARHPKVHEMDLVPTGMVPASDVFFSFDFRNNRFEPRIPTGRLPATTPENIIAYLNKVKEHESLPDGLEWRKNIFHLGGGHAGPDQADRYRGFLNEYKRKAEGIHLGANVNSYFVNFQPGNFLNVSSEVNAGLSLLTFFGHSSPVVTDLEIGLVSTNVNGYRNKGKYPVILMNGCYSGDAYFHNKNSFGEDWLVTPDRGAIAFMAQSFIGGDTPLNSFSDKFYEVAFNDDEFYGSTIGDIHKETIRNAQVSTNDVNIATMTQMVLQGDPAVRMYSPGKPDYTFENNQVSIKDARGDIAIAVSSGFTIAINAMNLGKAITDSVQIGIKRILPNGSELATVTNKVKPVHYKEQLMLHIPNVDISAAGMNRFEVYLDYENGVDELNENNNILEVQHFLPSSGLSVLSPIEFAIVTEKSVNLMVQSTQLRAEPKGVYFELDTTDTFSSSLKQSFQAQAGVLPAWEVILPTQLVDSTVFYWRARFDSFAKEEDTIWVESSFRYIDASTGGWSQSHPGQFAKSEFDKTSISNAAGWNFTPLLSNIEIRTVGGGKRFKTPDYGIFINSVTRVDNACGGFMSSDAPLMYFLVINNTTLEVVSVPGFTPCRFMGGLYQFGNLNNVSARTTVQRFLETIPEDYHVIAMSVNKVPFGEFSPELKAAFNKLGSKLINEIKTGYPFAMIGQQGGAIGSAQELTAGSPNPLEQDIKLIHQVSSYNTQGSITSSIIGPALTWSSLHYNIERYKAGNDSYKLKLFGIGADGNRELLNDAITTKTFNLSQVDAIKYPHLQLQAELSDTEDRTAPQLKQWMVYYQAAPEGVIRPDLVEVNDEIITQQASRGRIEMPMAFQNVTPYAFRDSITVEVTLTGEGIEPRVSRFKIEALQGNKTATFNHAIPTLDLDGSYKLSLYVNPQLQPEQQYQNNIYEVNFAVKSKLHPIMDVAFDGVHIMDGELVAPSPLISITMKDENKHVYLENADAMHVTLVDEMNNQKDVTIGNNPGEVQVFPADEKNDFRFEYKPKRLENGRYKLVVRGNDATGKASGLSAYEINFMVDNESKITNFYPYPNPFSTKTQFIFTLTGGVIPNDFKIQIMTVTGKIVKEILREEIGPIRIGNNKTEYAWDGTDMYGDKLANGVYLYRVVMPKDTEEMKHIWKKGDKGFVNGYGKVYILR